jgi:bifunctional isochorismate lyase/aryl carrier protein
MTEVALSEARIREDVAEVLDIRPDQVVDDQQLVEQGMDSVRLMTLVERWRALGVEIDFLTLADDPTLKRWFSLMAG